MSPRRVWTAVVLALALAPLACHQTAAVDCPPAPTSGCPDGGGPSFTDVYTNVIHPVCVGCHSPDGGERSTLLLTYQQIYGKGGQEANLIRTEVFYSCLMPPSNAPLMLTAEQRQTLFDWLVCGAPNDPVPDAGAGD